MEDKIIIGIVVALVLGAHVWLFKWVKLKVDEAAIMKFLRESDDHKSRSSEAISSNTNIALNRVSIVCIKSKVIRRNAKEKGTWHLN